MTRKDVYAIVRVGTVERCHSLSQLVKEHHEQPKKSLGIYHIERVSVGVSSKYQ